MFIFAGAALSTLICLACGYYAWRAYRTREHAAPNSKDTYGPVSTHDFRGYLVAQTAYYAPRIYIDMSFFGLSALLAFLLFWLAQQSEIDWSQTDRTTAMLWILGTWFLGTGLLAAFRQALSTLMDMADATLDNARRSLSPEAVAVINQYIQETETETEAAEGAEPQDNRPSQAAANSQAPETNYAQQQTDQQAAYAQQLAEYVRRTQAIARQQQQAVASHAQPPAQTANFGQPIPRGGYPQHTQPPQQGGHQRPPAP